MSFDMEYKSRRSESIRLLLRLGAVAILLVSYGCMSQPPVPQDYFYRLPELHPTEIASNNKNFGTIGVAQLQAEGVYRERPILYVDARKPLEVMQYHYRHWTQVPVQLIQDSLLEFLREANVADQVIRYSPGNNADLLIQGRLMKFERIENGNQAKVAVELEVEYVSRSSGDVKTRLKNYKATVNAQGEAIHDSVQAFGDALGRIFNNILKDMQDVN